MPEIWKLAMQLFSCLFLFELMKGRWQTTKPDGISVFFLIYALEGYAGGSSCVTFIVERLTVSENRAKIKDHISNSSVLL